MLETEIIEDLQSKISPKRMQHILGVVEAAETLAKCYGEDINKARIAALLHDCAKELKVKEMAKIIEKAGLLVDSEVLNNPALLHGPAGAILAVSFYGVEDLDILEAIRVHTTGKVDMSRLDKIIFLADYIEKNRDFHGVEEMRKLAFIDLDKAVLAGYDSTISYLIEKKQSIYSKTILGRNDIIFKIKNLR